MLGRFLLFVNDSKGNLINRLYHTVPDAKITYVRDEESFKLTRVLIGSRKRVGKFAYQGVILSEQDEGYKVISMPPLPPSDEPLDALPEGASIKRLKDGTTITFYFYNGDWVISTFRGYEVDKLMVGPSDSYTDVVHEVLIRYNNFSLTKLDPKKCYTIGFSHPLTHCTSDCEAWFIQSVDLEKINRGEDGWCYNEDIGIPVQEEVPCVDINELKNDETDLGYIVRINLRYYRIESSLMKNIRLTHYHEKLHGHRA